MENQLDEIRKQNYRSWYQDGLAELAMGGLFLALAVFYGFQALLEPANYLTAILSLALIVLIIGGVFFVRRLTGTLKTRLTYPRAGYVAFQRTQRNRRVILFALLFGAVIGLMMGVIREEVYWTPAALGGIFALVWAYYGYRSGLARFYLLALLMGAAGVGISVLTPNQPLALLAFYAVCAAGMLLSGGITLVRFLLSHPVQAEDSDRAA